MCKWTANQLHLSISDINNSYSTSPSKLSTHSALCRTFHNTVQDITGLTSSRVVLENVSDDLQILPDDQNLNSSHLQCLQCLLHTEAVAPRILRDLVKIFP